MIISKKLKEFIDNAKKTDAYWLERTKLDFAIEMEKRRKRMHISNADIAEKIGTSAAYISKVFRGDANFTIESMVKLSRATGGKLHIKIIDESAVVDSSVWAGKLHNINSANHNSYTTPIRTLTVLEQFKQAA